MGNFNDFDDIVRVPDLVLALAIGTEALLAMLQPLLGAGWGMWTIYLLGATAALWVAMRYRWSH
jgi:hypothetical protein